PQAAEGAPAAPRRARGHAVRHRRARRGQRGAARVQRGGGLEQPAAPGRERGAPYGGGGDLGDRRGAPRQQPGSPGDRRRALAPLNDDLTNALTSVGIPILILGRDGCIRRFTPAAARLFALIPADVGRPLTDITSKLSPLDLAATTERVIERLAPDERLVQDD